MLRTLGIRTLVVALGFFSWGGASTGNAATWDGGGSDGNWSTAANWAGDVALVPNDLLQFGGTTNLLTNNDTTADTQYNGIDFLNTAGSFTLNGNSIILLGDINQLSNNAQTINLPLLLDGTPVNVGGAGTGALLLGQVALGTTPTASAASVNPNTLNINRSVSTTGFAAQTNTATANTLTIDTGQTLTVNGAFVVGIPLVHSNPNPLGSTVTSLTGSGAGSLVVNGGEEFFRVGLVRSNGGATGPDPDAFLDLSALSNFSYGATTGQLRVGDGNSQGTFTLAFTGNTITAAQVRVGDSGLDDGGTGGSNNNNGGRSILNLGGGTNVINTDTLIIGRIKSGGTVQFAGATGTLTIAGQAGGATTADIQVGSSNNATGSGDESMLLLSGHSVTVQGGDVVLGQLAGGGGGNSARGLATFDTGTFNAQSVRLGVNTSGGSTSGATGTLRIGGDAPNPAATGVLNVSEEFFIAQRTNATATAGPSIGVFTVNGGTANIGTDILDVSTTVSDAGPNQTTVTVDGGTLNMMGNDIGSRAAPLTTINVNSGSLTNAGLIAGRAISLGAAANITGTPTYVLPDLGTLTSGLASLNLVSGGGIEGGGTGGGSVTGNVVAQNGSHISVGLGSTLSFGNDLSINGGSRLDVTANAIPSQPSINVAGTLSTSGGAGSVPINVSNVLTAGTYTLVDYVNPIGGSGFGAFALGTLPPRVVANLVNNGGNQSIDLNVVSVDRAKWTGAQSTQWSTATLPAPKNWTLVNAGGQTDYIDGDNPLFDDSATNTNVDVSVADVHPAAVEFNNTTKNYTVTGSKSVISPGTFTKTGTGTVSLAVPATFAGAASVGAGGTLQIGNGGTTGNLTAASLANEGTLRFNHTGDVTFSTPVSGSGNVVHAGTGTTTLSGASTHTGTTDIQTGTVKTTNSGSLGAPGSGIVNIASGATLDVGGSTATNNTSFGAKQINVVGTGVGGLGAIVNSNTANGQQNALQLVTLTGNTTFGAYGRFDLRDLAPADVAPVLDLAGHTLTKKGTSHFGIVAGTITDGNIVVEEGIFAIEGASTVTGTGLITFQDNTELRFFGTAGAGTITRPMRFNGSVGIHNNDDAASTFDSPVTLNGSITYTWVNDADPVSPTTQNGVITELGGARGIEAKTLNAANSLVLTADNAFTGSLAVSGPGTVNISPASLTPYLGNTANVSLGSNSVLGLNYTGTDTIGALIVNGVSLAPGVYATPGAGFIDLPQIAATSTGTLTVTTQILPGDFNDDNTVDARDYVVWRNNEGTFNTLANDPLSGTEVDGDQYNFWRANFGNSIPGSGGGAGLAAVPEPASGMLAVFAGLVVALSTRRLRSAS